MGSSKKKEEADAVRPKSLERRGPIPGNDRCGLQGSDRRKSEVRVCEEGLRHSKEDTVGGLDGEKKVVGREETREMGQGCEGRFR